MKQYFGGQKALAGRKGFTLLEVLVVVVIAVLVTMFAVPSYRKAQDRNRFMAASGVLLDLGNAMRMFKADYGTKVSISSQTITANASGTCPDEPSSSNLVLFLQCHKYLNNIPLQSSTYQGYQFAVSTKNTANCGSNCTKSGAVACMSGTNSISEYTCAWVDNGGILRTK